MPRLASEAEMVGLDTNVIVRYIAQDDPVQSAAATQIFEDIITDENHGFISSIAMCETIWVLSRAYGQPREKLVQVIDALLKADNLELEHRDLVWNAMDDFRTGKADFSDYLIARIGKAQGASTTLSFDGNALKAKALFSSAGRV